MIYRIQLMSAIMFAAFGLLSVLLIWTLHRQWWKIRGVRRALWMAPVIGILFCGLWFLVRYFEIEGLESFIGSITTAFVMAFIALFLVLPLTGLILTGERVTRWALQRRRKEAASEQKAMEITGIRPVEEKNEALQTDHAAPGRETTTAVVASEGRTIDPGEDQNLTRKKGSLILRPNEPEQIDRTRRSIIVTGTAAIPALAIGTGMWGVIGSERDVQFTPYEAFFPGLHPDLEGFRILHLSDLHLGYYIRLEDLEKIMIGAEKIRPDLVLVTGDLSDDLEVYDEALSMISQLNPQYGTFASLGNHEYYRGIREVRQAFDRGPLPLLFEQGTTLKVGSTELYVGGADDPVGAGWRSERRPDGERYEKDEYLLQSAEKAFDGAPSEAFNLLMSHRPEGFDAAAAMGIDFTLAGHTHAGGQMGWNGRSLVETWFGLGKYMWGPYEKNGGRNRLYTSAGAGHWLPFRLGVPREAPVYTLRRA